MLDGEDATTRHAQTTTTATATNDCHNWNDGPTVAFPRPLRAFLSAL